MIKNIFWYISPISPEALCGWICAKFGIATGVTDFITCDTFCGYGLRGVDFVGGRSLPFPIDKATRC